MAGIHGRARSRRRKRASAHVRRLRRRQRMNSPPAMPSPLKRAARRNRLQPVSKMPGREFIHGRLADIHGQARPRRRKRTHARHPRGRATGSE